MHAGSQANRQARAGDNLREQWWNLLTWDTTKVPNKSTRKLSGSETHRSNFKKCSFIPWLQLCGVIYFGAIQGIICFSTRNITYNPSSLSHAVKGHSLSVQLFSWVFTTHVPWSPARLFFLMSVISLSIPITHLTQETFVRTPWPWLQFCPYRFPWHTVPLPGSWSLTGSLITLFLGNSHSVSQLCSAWSITNGPAAATAWQTCKSQWQTESPCSICGLYSVCTSDNPAKRQSNPFQHWY